MNPFEIIRILWPTLFFTKLFIQRIQHEIVWCRTEVCTTYPWLNNKTLSDLRQHSYGIHIMATPWTNFEYFIYVVFGFHWIPMTGKINHNMTISQWFQCSIYEIDKLFIYLLYAMSGERTGKGGGENRNERSYRS